MKEKDLREKHLFSKNDVFSSAWNELSGDEKTCAQPPLLFAADDLTEAPTELVTIINGALLHRYRDVFKQCKDKFGLNIAFFGLENQTEPEGDMPVRVMLYDALGYYAQTQQHDRPKKLIPIFTRVLYFGYTKRWNTPRSIGDQCTILPSLASRFQNYRIEVFELAWLSDEQIERLTGDLKVLAVFLRKMRRQELDDWPDLEIKYVPEVLDLLTAITGHRQLKQNKRKYAKRQGRITMCELFQKHDNDLIKKGMKQGEAKGRAEGMKQGKAEGEKRGLAKGMAQKALDIAKNLIAMHMPEEDVAKATGLSLKQVQALVVGA